MKLSKIKATNFKGLNFELELSPMTFLVGTNFAGKTARADAIRFLLLGYLPELGKRSSDAFRLSSGREMIVEGTLDDERTIRRRLFLKGDSVKTEEDVPEELADVGKLAVMLNAEEYFSLSDRARVDYVFANIKLSGDWSISAIQRRAFGDEVAQLSLDPTPDDTPQSFVERAIERVANLAKAERSKAEQMGETAKGLAHLRMADKPEMELSRIEQEATRIAAELEQAVASKSASDAVQFEALKAFKRRREIEVELRTVEQAEAKLAGLREELAGTDREIADLPIIPSEIAVDGLRTDKVQAQIDLNDARRDWRNATEALGAAQRVLDEIDGKTECPYCGATGDGWKALKRSELGRLIADQGRKVEELQRAGEASKTRLEAADRALAAAEATKRSLGASNDRKTGVLRRIAESEGALGRSTALRDELSRLPEAGPEPTPANDGSVVSSKRQALASLETVRKAALGRKNDLRRLAEAEEAREKAEKAAEVAKAAGKVLREIQAEMVESAFGPLLATANGFFGEVLKTPLAYHEGEIGTWRDGLFVGHRTFSGTEKALCYAAIQAALAIKSPIRIMLIDELARLDDANLLKTIRRAEWGLKESTIDLFVGIDTGRASLYKGFNPGDSSCSVVTIA